MASLHQWNLLKTLKNVENRMCVDCCLPLTKNDSYSSSYGTWLCSVCANMHRVILSQDGVWVKSALNDEWSDEEINTVIKCNIDIGGNIGYNEVYERYIPHGWTKPNATESSMKDREFWMRCKYASRAFMLPHQIGYDMNLHSQSHVEMNTLHKHDANPAGVLPSRIADFFIVIGAAAKHVSKPKPGNINSSGSDAPGNVGLKDIDLKPEIQCTYPNANAYPDMQIPDMLGEFVYTHGIKLSIVEKQPKFHTFVLTDVTGAKLYGCALNIYELMDPSELTNELGVSMEMLNTLVEHGETQCNETRPDSSNSATIYPVLYAPKALVILSHYSFFHLFKQYLDVIYRLSLSSLPLPIERYIINFISEMPLPPQGVTEVNYILPTKTLQVTRPRKNQLPMVDISYRPLFTALSVDHIISIFTALCCEYPVCIISNNTSLLTPICESLLSFLFPFTWQGAYIPILPDAMTEILDAPVPYLIGMQRDYFDKYDMHLVRNRPAGTIFVDVDKDEVHVGTVDDLFGDQCSEEEPMLLNIDKPNAKMLTKLRDGLVKYGGCIHHNPSGHYLDALQSCGVAFPQNEHLIPLKVDGHYNGTNVITSKDNKSTTNSVTSNVNPSGSQEYCTKLVSGDANYNSNPTTKKMNDAYAQSMSDPLYNNPPGGGKGTDAFCAQEVRFAFLRFFVALLLDYHDYFTYPDTGVGADSMNMNTFVLPDNANYSPPSISRDSDISSVAASDNGMISARRSDSMSSVDSTVSVSKRKSALGTLFGGKDAAGANGSGEDPAMIAAVNGIHPVFSTEKYVQQHPNDLFLKNITQTQIFAKFLQEKISSLVVENDIKYNGGRGTGSSIGIGNNNEPSPSLSQAVSSEVRYFDESILSKRNRSRMKLVKNETPFLSDMCESVSETYTTPTPNNYGIPMDSTFTYSKFPTKLDSKYCTPVRHPKLLVKNVEVVRINSQALTTANILSNAGTHAHGHGGKRRLSDASVDESHHGQFHYMGISSLEAYLEEVQLQHDQTTRCVVVLQSLVRMKAQYKLFHARFSELKRLLALGNYRRRILQFVRMTLCKCRYQRWRRSAIRLQAKFRGRKQCKIFNQVIKKRVISLQASFRRRKDMRNLKNLCHSLIIEIRQYLPLLWQLSGTSLLHRSRFWRFLEVLSVSTPPLSLSRSQTDHQALVHARYVALAVYSKEFQKLFNGLGYNCMSAGVVCRSSAAIVASGLSMHRTVRSLSQCLGYIIANHAQLINLASPSKSNGNYKRIDMASERLELYTIMKQHFSEDIKDEVFHNFDLKVTRKRKQTLANLLWTSVTVNTDPNESNIHMDSAAAIVLQIYYTQYLKSNSGSISHVETISNSNTRTVTGVCDRLLVSANRHHSLNTSGSVMELLITPADTDWLQCVYAIPVYAAVGEFGTVIAKRYSDLHEKCRLVAEVEAGHGAHSLLSRTSTYTDGYLNNRRYSSSRSSKPNFQMGIGMPNYPSNRSIINSSTHSRSGSGLAPSISTSIAGAGASGHGRSPSRMGMGTPVRRPSRYFLDINPDVHV